MFMHDDFKYLFVVTLINHYNFLSLSNMFNYIIGMLTILLVLVILIWINIIEFINGVPILKLLVLYFKIVNLVRLTEKIIT